MCEHNHEESVRRKREQEKEVKTRNRKWRREKKNGEKEKMKREQNLFFSLYLSFSSFTKFIPSIQNIMRKSIPMQNNDLEVELFPIHKVLHMHTIAQDWYLLLSIGTYSIMRSKKMKEKEKEKEKEKGL